jgi:hypothetical protein
VVVEARRDADARLRLEAALQAHGSPPESHS